MKKTISKKLAFTVVAVFVIIHSLIFSVYCTDKNEVVLFTEETANTLNNSDETFNNNDISLRANQVITTPKNIMDTQTQKITGKVKQTDSQQEKAQAEENNTPLKLTVAFAFVFLAFTAVYIVVNRKKRAS